MLQLTLNLKGVNNMNKKYMDPEMNVTLFESVDVITASGFDGEEDTNLPGLVAID